MSSTKFAQPLRLNPKPSRILIGLLTAGHLGALVVLVPLDLSIIIKMIIAMALVVSWVVAMRKQPGRMNEDHAFGITAIFAFQRFSAKGLAAFSGFSSDPTKLTGNRVSTSTGYGARIGYQGKLLPILRVGASFQTKIYMSEN